MSLEVEVKSALSKIGADVNAFMAAQKERTKELGDKHAELQALVIDVAQKQVRDRGDGGGHYEPFGGGLRAAIEASAKDIEAVVAGKTRYASIGLPKGFMSPQAAILSGGGLAFPDRRESIVAPVVRRLTVRDLLPSVPVGSNALQFIKETAFTNAAAPVSEGDTKPESNLTFSVETAPIVTIAHWVSASKQILDDWGLLQAYIDGRLRYGLALAEEDQLLKGSGIGTNLNGLYTQAAAFSGGGQKIDHLRKAVLALENLEYQPNGIILNPTDWQEITSLKSTTGEYLFGAPNATVERRLWNIPVVVTTAMTNETFMVGDFSQAGVVLDREEARVDISTESGDSFIKNMVVVRCEERIGLAVWRPGALLKGAFGS